MNKRRVLGTESQS